MLGIKHEACLDLPQSAKPGQQHLQLGFCLGQKRMRFRGEKGRENRLGFTMLGKGGGEVPMKRREALPRKARYETEWEKADEKGRHGLLFP